jgi:hypothetical protein
MNNDFLKKSKTCREALDRIKENKTVSVGSLGTALKYVLEIRLMRPCTLYRAEYGEIDFAVHIARFRLQWPPKAEGVRLVCKHLEGDKFISTPFDVMGPDPLMDLIEAVEVSMNSVSPFDTE